jgi:hypothetical protein
VVLALLGIAGSRRFFLIVAVIARRARRTLKGSDFGAILAAEGIRVCRGIALDR